MNKQLLTTGISGAIAVALGALGAHWLKAQLAAGNITADQFSGYESAVTYHMYHTLAMLLVIVLKNQINNSAITWAYRLFFVGILLFSGSLYFLCTRNLWGAEWLRVLGPVTPLGGLCFIAGWLCLAFSLAKKLKT